MRGDFISIRQAIHFAWPLLKRRFGLFAAILLTFFGGWVALEIVVISGQRFGILLWVVAHLVFLFFAAGLEIGLLKICLSLHDGREPKYSAAFAHLSLGPIFLAGQLLYLLMVVIGLALLVAPGVYLALRYGLFGYCMADGKVNLGSSLAASAELSAGRMTYLLRIFAILFMLNLLGACVLGIGLVVTIPLSSLMVAAVYRRLGG